MKKNISNYISDLLLLIGLICANFIILYFGVNLINEYFTNEMILLNIISFYGLATLIIVLFKCGFETLELFKKEVKK